MASEPWDAGAGQFGERTGFDAGHGGMVVVGGGGIGGGRPGRPGGVGGSAARARRDERHRVGGIDGVSSAAWQCFRRLGRGQGRRAKLGGRNGRIQPGVDDHPGPCQRGGCDGAANVGNGVVARPGGGPYSAAGATLAAPDFGLDGSGRERIASAALRVVDTGRSVPQTLPPSRGGRGHSPLHHRQRVRHAVARGFPPRPAR